MHAQGTITRRQVSPLGCECLSIFLKSVHEDRCGLRAALRYARSDLAAVGRGEKIIDGAGCAAVGCAQGRDIDKFALAQEIPRSAIRAPDGMAFISFVSKVSAERKLCCSRIGSMTGWTIRSERSMSSLANLISGRWVSMAPTQLLQGGRRITRRPCSRSTICMATLTSDHTASVASRSLQTAKSRHPTLSPYPLATRRVVRSRWALHVLQAQ
jgi:hypothetical protein